jgi:hypothetical protein
MTDILGRLGDLPDLGTDALLTVLATVLDGLGRATEFSGEQIDRLGELERQFADIVRTARAG